MYVCMCIQGREGEKRNSELLLNVVHRVVSLAIKKNPLRTDKEDSKKQQRIRIYFHSSFEASIIPPCALHTSEAPSIIHSSWSVSIYFGTIFQEEHEIHLLA